MWDSHLVWIKIEIDPIKSFPADSKPTIFASYRAVSKTSKVLKIRNEKKLSEDVTVSARIRWTVPLLLPHKRDGFLRVFKDCRKLYAVTEQNINLIRRMYDCIDSTKENSAFWRLTRTIRNGKYRSKKKIDMRQISFPITGCINSCKSHLASGTLQVCSNER